MQASFVHISNEAKTRQYLVGRGLLRSKGLGMLLISRRLLLLPWILLLLSRVLSDISAFAGNGGCSGSLLSERSRLGWRFSLGEEGECQSMYSAHYPL